MSEHYKINFSHPEYEVDTRLALLEQALEYLFREIQELKDQIRNKK